MSLIERHEKGNRRVDLFHWVFLVLIASLLTTLGYHQVIENRNYRLKEEMQAQRRILTPGSRGDVFDREGKLLVGNRPRFSAVIYPDDIRKELSKEYINMVRKARNAKAKIKGNSSLQAILSQVLPNGKRQRGAFEIRGTGQPHASRVVVWQNQKRSIRSNAKGEWKVFFDQFDPERRFHLDLEPESKHVKVRIAGLIEVEVTRDPSGSDWRLYSQKKIRIDSAKLKLDSNFAVVGKYLRQINEVTGRAEVIDRVALKNHFDTRLLLPLRLADSLEAEEYARLIENTPVDSPIQILTEAARHYPQGSVAAHVLGYVAVAKSVDPSAIPGSDLSTVSYKGKTGKSGIEKFFNEYLSGSDGGEIWHVDPVGYQYKRIHHKAPSKGKNLHLSLDLDLQKHCEEFLSEAISKISSGRETDDPDWLKIVNKRVHRHLAKTSDLEDLEAKEIATLLTRSNQPKTAKEIVESLNIDLKPQTLEELLDPLLASGSLTKTNQEGSSPSYFLSDPPPTPGAIVVLDVKTGEILAMASKPDYNLQELSPRISNKTFRKIQREGAWLPRAIHPGYPPASTYKLMTAIAALRTGNLTPDFEHDCRGEYKAMRCWNPNGHGVMNLRKAEAGSCNCYFFRIGELTGHKALIAESKRFGMHQAPEIELPGVPDKPLVPDPEWKRRKLNESWELEDTLNISIGQGGFKLSPLQVACFMASIARGETRTKPTLLRVEGGAPDHGGEPIGLSPEHYEEMIQGMAEAASPQGTAYTCKVPGIQVAAKTGTGQWRANNMKLSIAWCAGFAPLRNPEVAIAVMIEGVVPQDNIGGGKSAAPIAGKVLSKYFEKKNARHTSTP